MRLSPEWPWFVPKYKQLEIGFARPATAGRTDHRLHRPVFDKPPGAGTQFSDTKPEILKKIKPFDIRAINTL